MPLTPLLHQLSFLREIDRLKNVVRQSPLLDKSRKENSAEHSWHLSVYAMVLNDYASGTVDVHRVIKMLLLHDIVEIDVGDYPIHGGSSADVQAEEEARAAARIFGLLPQQQGTEFLSLWQEFERAESDDATFAKALDRFQPLLINVFTDGGTWNQNDVSMDQVLSRYGPAIKRGAPALWEVCEQWVTQHFSDRPTATLRQPEN
ncbi:HD domain-containing protein [Alcaligenaceae bacterium A4P071]|nr:HD domain-containing protein [Alcaligenaceae bacterium A4P071]